jgi:hypothetical protein
VGTHPSCDVEGHVICAYATAGTHLSPVGHGCWHCSSHLGLCATMPTGLEHWRIASGWRGSTYRVGRIIVEDCVGRMSARGRRHSLSRTTVNTGLSLATGLLGEVTRACPASPMCVTTTTWYRHQPLCDPRNATKWPRVEIAKTTPTEEDTIADVTVLQVMDSHTVSSVC